MTIEVLKSKIHRVTVTGAELDYVGSITIDPVLMDAVDLVAGEKVQVVNTNNGERLETYVIQGAKNSGEITLNGAGLIQCDMGLRRKIGSSTDPTTCTPSKKFKRLIIHATTQCNMRIIAR